MSQLRDVRMSALDNGAVIVTTQSSEKVISQNGFADWQAALSFISRLTTTPPTLSLINLESLKPGLTD